ncbi:MAG: hypothetical protein IKZ98_04155 [Clostridia bacterium]|nr:hypothetical protein [Clostridia bacterium]
MKRWTTIGPEWKTENVFRILQLLKDEHIPYKMPYSDVFFANIFHMPSLDRKWGILVRTKDWAKTVDLLVHEGLACRNLWKDSAVEQTQPAKAELYNGFCAPVPSR